MPSNVLSASRAGPGSVVVTTTANISAQVVGVGIVREVSASAPTDGGGLGAAIQAYGSRRRFMQMVEYDPRLARKLGIRGKLQTLD
jgi:hypothetical protein